MGPIRHITRFAHTVCLIALSSVCLATPTWGQLTQADVPTNEQLQDLIDETLLGGLGIGQMPANDFVVDNPNAYDGCDGDPACLAVIADIGSGQTPLMEEAEDALLLIDQDRDPWDVVGDGLVGLTNSCALRGEDVFEISTERFEYRCESGLAVEQDVRSCALTLVHQVSADATYECAVTQSDDGTLIIADECEALDGNPVCDLERVECASEGGSNFDNVQCRVGAETVTTNPVCERELVHRLALEFIYECEFVYNRTTGEWAPDAECAAHLASDTCAEDGDSCAETYPPDYQVESCLIGSDVVYDDVICDAHLEVRSTEAAVYQVKRLWDVALADFKPNAPYLAALEGRCAIGSETCLVPEPVVLDTQVCERGLKIEATSEACESIRVVETDDDYRYIADRQWNSGSNRHVPSAAYSALSASCQAGEEVCSQITPEVIDLYNCERGFRIDTDKLSCIAAIKAIVDADYLYTGRQRWEAASGTFIGNTVSAAAEAALGQQACVAGNRVCTEPSPGVFETRQCDVGYRSSFVERTINRDFIVTTDTDYIYNTKESWNNAAGNFTASSALLSVRAAGANCQQRSKVCTVAGPGVFSTYDCVAGYRVQYENEVCFRTRAVSIDKDYIYQAKESWNNSSKRFNASSQLIKLRSTGTCDLKREFCSNASPGVFETWSCQIGTKETSRRESAQRAREVVVDEDYIYERYRNWNGSTHAGTSGWNAVNADASCTRTGSVCVSTTPPPYSSYSCLSGYEDKVVNVSCDVNRAVSVDEDYIYTVDRQYNYNARRWEGDSDYNAVRASGSNCQRQSTSCDRASPGVTSPVQCDKGYRMTPRAVSCQFHRSPIIDRDYEYIGYHTWNGSTHAADATAARAVSQSCQRTAIVNEQPHGDTRSTYVCERGSVTFGATSTCNAVLNVSAIPKQNWVYTAPEGSSAYNFLNSKIDCSRGGDKFVCAQAYRYIGITSITPADERGYVRRASEDSPGLGHMQVSPDCVLWKWEAVSKPPSRGGWGGHYYFEPDITFYANYVCRSSQAVSGTEYRGRRNIDVKAHYVAPNTPGLTHVKSKLDCKFNRNSGAQQVWNCLNSYPLPSATYRGQKTTYTFTDAWNTAGCHSGSYSQTCTSSGARTISGQSVSRSCWNYQRTYASSITQSHNSCQPPAGYRHVATKAKNRNIGISRSIEVLTYWKDHSLADVPNVRKGVSCLQGRWRNSTGSFIAVDECSSIISGYSQVSSVCVYQEGSTCQLWSKTYQKAQPGPTGGYSRTKSTYRCENAIGGSGVRAPRIIKDYVGITPWDTSGCASSAAQRSGLYDCSYTHNDVSSSKTVDGIARMGTWTRNHTWNCQVRTNVNTCPAGVAFNEWTPGKTQYAQNTPTSSPVSLNKGGSLSGFDQLSAFSSVMDLKFAPTKPRYVRTASLDRNVAVIGLPRPPFDDKFSVRSKTSELEAAGAAPPVRYAGVGDHTATGQICLAYYQGSCTLWRKNFSREEVDPSGGCADQSEVWRCERAVSSAGSASIVRDIVSDTMNAAQCNAYASNSAYQLIKSSNIAGGSRTINGLSVYRSYWTTRRTYKRVDRIRTETCSPPSGAVVHNTECSWADSAGTCRLLKRNYRLYLPDPSGGCAKYKDTFRCENQNHGTAQSKVHDIVSERWATAPSFHPSRQGCKRVSYNYLDRATRNVSGLPLDRYWTLNEVYDCPVYTPVNTCTSIPSGSPETSRNCFFTNPNGQCGVYNVSYRVERPDPSGGCHEKTFEYQCDSPVSGIGNPVAIPAQVDGVVWDDAQCAPHQNDVACTQTRERCTEGEGTRVIDGVSVYQSCWKQERVYECAARTDTNTCSVPSGASLDKVDCLWRDRAGVCRLERKHYLKAEHDPSGGCHQYTYDHRCEAAVSGITPSETINHYVGVTLDTSPEVALKAGYQACARKTSSGSAVCTEGRQTRVINGVSVTRDCWAMDIKYECESRETFQGCARKPQEREIARDCIWRDRGGRCRANRLTYEWEVFDPSGGCHAFERSYRCENKLKSGGQTLVPNETVHHLVSANLDETACTAAVRAKQDARTSCRETRRTCSQGPETRTLTGGVQLYKACWAYDVVYDCDVRQDVDTCEIPDGARQSTTPTNCLWRDRNGTCQLTEFNYDVPRFDPTGECTTYSHDFLCEERVPAAGTPTATITEVERVYWDRTQCGAVEAQTYDEGRSCTFASSCLEGPETRSINGLDVRESCWKDRREYSCEKDIPIDTCDVPFGARELSSICTRPGFGPLCKLFETTFEWRVRDASGGCHAYAADAACAANIAMPTQPDRWDYSLSTDRMIRDGCPREILESPSCREVKRTCTDLAPSRRVPDRLFGVDGLSFVAANPASVPEHNAACWAWNIEYECSDTSTVNTCSTSDFAGCDELPDRCVQDDRTGRCVQFEKNYDCPIEGTGGCATRATTFICEGETTVQSAAFDLPDMATGDIVPFSEAAALLASNDNAAVSAIDFSAVERRVRQGSMFKTTPVERIGPTPDYLQFAQAAQPGFTPIEVRAKVIETFWDESACSRWHSETTGAAPTCSLVASNCLDAGSGVPENVRRAQDDYHQRYVGNAPKQVVECWNEEQIYECGATSALAACDARVDSCVEGLSTCRVRAEDGSCLLEEKSYQCQTAACEPQRVMCDERKGNAAYAGHKYQCSIITQTSTGLYEGDEWYDVRGLDQIDRLGDEITMVLNSCEGFAGCASHVVDYKTERTLANGVGDYGTQTQGFRNRTTTVYNKYCDTPAAAVSNAATYFGDVSEGDDADSASCSGYEDNTLCSVLSTQCVGTEHSAINLELGEVQSMGCIGLERKIYSCEPEPTASGVACSGACEGWVHQYSCDAQIDGVGTPVDDGPLEVQSGVDDTACNTLEDDETCAQQTEVCTEGPQTRLIDGIPVFADCWSWSRDYLCERVLGNSDSCEVPSDCDYVSDKCLGRSASGVCLSTEHLYSCETTTEHLITDGSAGTCTPEESGGMVVNDPNGDQDADQGTSIIDAIAALNSMKEGGEEHSDNTSAPNIFGGEPLKCGKLVLGAKNCCKRSGILIGLGCNQSETTLQARRQEGLCIGLGSYCSSKALFGACLKKKETFCCYQSELARIVVETGMRQQGHDLGSAKSPTCEGFTVEKFQQLDLGDTDFSSVADTMLDQLDLTDRDALAERMRQRISEMSNGG